MKGKLADGTQRHSTIMCIVHSDVVSKLVQSIGDNDEGAAQGASQGIVKLAMNSK